jgi:hypothetical protein
VPLVKSATPDPLRPYTFHGVHLEWEQGRDQAIGDCPWCGREGKFYVNIENGLWDCKICTPGMGGEGGGNSLTFLKRLWEESDKRNTSEELDNLARDRRLLYPETLTYWGVTKSIITNDWIIPAYGVKGNLTQLYRYIHNRVEGRMMLLPTPTLTHGIIGLNLFNKDRPNIHICEGPWDGMGMWELMRTAKTDYEEGGLTPTGSEASSLLSKTNVIAMPTCTSYREEWGSLLEGKVVTLFFDSDHPRTHNKTVSRAGYDGMVHVARLLSKRSPSVKSLHYICWGKEGYDPEQTSGYDVRDEICHGELRERLGKLSGLFGKVQPIPTDWIPGRDKKSEKGKTEMDIVHCDNWKELVTAWRRPMKWLDGLDKALSVMLACVVSTKALGDQLWVMVIGPAACGKSTLCEALSVNKKYILAKSTIRGFHSGFKTDQAGTEDHGLVAKLAGKTLVTKDGDTLLTSPNLPQILAEARDIYDSTSRTHYRNATSRDYQGIRMTWILCGTSGLRQIDSSELGERFLKCSIMDRIDDELEDEILWRVVNRADRSMTYEADGDIETQYDPDMVKAMQLTGGYVSYLREHAQSLLSAVTLDEASLIRCLRLGKFVAYTRARPSKKQDESVEREFAARLASQMTRMAKCLAVVLNMKKVTVDSDVMVRLTKVAMDTAKGRTCDIIKHLAKSGEKGLELGTVATLTNHTEDKERTLLRFLRHIGAVEVYRPDAKKMGISPRPHWRLTSRMAKLYQEIMQSNA